MSAAPASQSDLKKTCSKYMGKAVAFVDAQCLPIGLVMALIFGLLVPIIGVTLGQKGVMSYVCIICIFLITGLRLNTAEAMAALGAHREIILGITSIMAVTSLLGSFLTTLLPLNPIDFKHGLIIFFCTPCAVAYSVILTKQAGGNAALAIFLVVLSNTLGSFITPMTMSLFIKAGEVKLPVSDLVAQLVGTILGPLVVGKALQELPFNDHLVRRTATTWGKQLALFSNTLLACIPWLKISDSAYRGTFNVVKAEDVCIMGAWFFCVHLVFLAINFTLSSVVCKDLKLKKAVVMTASTKTLPVALTIISFLPKEFGDPGLLAIPSIVCQFIQTMFDGVLASSWNSRTKAAEAKAAKADETNEASAGDLEAAAVASSILAAATPAPPVDYPAAVELPDSLGEEITRVPPATRNSIAEGLAERSGASTSSS